MEKVITDLRMGIPVVIEGADESVFALAVEMMWKENLQQFRDIAGKSAEYLLLTANRMKVVSNFSGDNVAVIESGGLDVDGLRNLAGVNGVVSIPEPDIAENNNIPSSLADAAVRLAQIAEVIPAILAVNITDTATTGFTTISASSISRYEKDFAANLEPVVTAPLKLHNAPDAEITLFRSAPGNREHYAIIIGGREKVLQMDAPLVRVHSSCFTGDLLGSMKCDCQQQLHAAMRHMDTQGGGILLYLTQEGRGIGLANKLRAYNLQEGGMDTVEANEFLGFADDDRAFLPAAAMLKRLGVGNVRILTNNPRKVAGLEQNGINITERVPLVIEAGEHNRGYMGVKFDKMGHLG